jgi:hypothetical protein
MRIGGEIKNWYENISKGQKKFVYFVSICLVLDLVLACFLWQYLFILSLVRKIKIHMKDRDASQPGILEGFFYNRKRFISRILKFK